MEPTWAPVPIHRSLDGEEEIGTPLDFVDCHPLVGGDQCVRLFVCPLQDVEIVEGEVFTRVRREQLPDQGAFTRLPRAGEDDHGKGVQRLMDQRREMALQWGVANYSCHA